MDQKEKLCYKSVCHLVCSAIKNYHSSYTWTCLPMGLPGSSKWSLHVWWRLGNIISCLLYSPSDIFIIAIILMGNDDHARSWQMQTHQLMHWQQEIMVQKGLDSVGQNTWWAEHCVYSLLLDCHGKSLVSRKLVSFRGKESALTILLTIGTS